MLPKITEGCRCCICMGLSFGDFVPALVRAGVRFERVILVGRHDQAAA